MPPTMGRPVRRLCLPRHHTVFPPRHETDARLIAGIGGLILNSAVTLLDISPIRMRNRTRLPNAGKLVAPKTVPGNLINPIFPQYGIMNAVRR